MMAGVIRAMIPAAILGVILGVVPRIAEAETGSEGWLRYSRITEPGALRQYKSLPHRIVQAGTSP